MKETVEWNEYVIKLSEKVNETFKAKKTKDNEHLWTAFDNTDEKIRIARAADHGPHLYKAAHKKLGGTMTIHQQDLGKNPVTGDVWQTVDWNETALKAKAKGIADADNKIEDFLNLFYHGTDVEYQKAREHYQVMLSYKRMADATLACRKGKTI